MKSEVSKLAKKLESDQEKSKVSWLSDFSQESLRKSSEMEIKPKLTIEALGIENAKEVVILTEPYLVEIPKEKAIGSSNKIWMMDLEYNSVAHQFICQSGSFRFQLGVLLEKLGFLEPSELIGLPIKIWKTTSYINTPSFKGNAEVYQILII